MKRIARAKRTPTTQTSIRAALRADSFLRPSVKDGLGAIKPAHKGYFEDTARGQFDDSLDIDEGFLKGREQENRWDYLLGCKRGRRLIAVEPHAADNHEIKTVIKKRKFAMHQLGSHLRAGKKIDKWIWVASGKTRFLAIEKARFILAQNGIEFISGQIRDDHL